MGQVETRESIVLQSGNARLFGILHLPQGIKKPPVVFFCHGLAGNKIGKDRIYVEIAYHLSKLGIASFRLDCRGSGDSDGLFQDVLPEHFVEDSLIGLNYLKNNPKIDPDRIGLFARSFGGPIAIETATKFKDIKSIVLWCPMFSGKQWRDQWELLATNTIDEGAAIQIMRINGQQGSPQFFEKFVKINIEENLRELNGIPLLHIHGEADHWVSIKDHALDYERVRKPSQKTKYIRLPKTDHDFSNYEEKQEALKATLDWFDQTLTLDAKF